MFRSKAEANQTEVKAKQAKAKTKAIKPMGSVLDFRMG